MSYFVHTNATEGVLQNKSIELQISRGAAMITIYEPQQRIKSNGEIFSLKSLQQVSKDIQSLIDYAQKLKSPILVPLNEARNYCPSIGGREVQQDPLLGPHPAYLPSPDLDMSPLELYTKRQNNESTCAYTLSESVLAALDNSIETYHYSQQADSWKKYQKLLSARCPDGSYDQGEISDDFISLKFPQARAYNLILCGEHCRNLHERARINCTISDKQNWGDLGCGKVGGCETYSYNPKTMECRLSSLNNPKINKDWFYSEGNPGGITAINVKVRCQSSLLLQDLKMRAPRSQQHQDMIYVWSARAACLFEPFIHPTFRVYVKCESAAAMVESLIQPSISQLNGLKKRLEKKTNIFRKKRSTMQMKGLVGPKLINFLSDHMLKTIAPKLVHVPVFGPSIALVLTMAGTLLPLISQIAYQSQSEENHLISSGAFLHKKGVKINNHNWTIGKGEDLLKLDLPKMPQRHISIATWIFNVISRANFVFQSTQNILDNPIPQQRKIRKNLGNKKEIFFVTFCSNQHILRRQFFWVEGTSFNNPIKNLILVSLNTDLPLLEGWRSTSGIRDSKLGSIDYLCSSNFGKMDGLPKECLQHQAIGSPTQSIFPATSKYLIVKILGKSKIVQILCGNLHLPATYATKGIFLVIVGRNCELYSDGTMLVQAEDTKLDLGFQILIDSNQEYQNSSLMQSNLRKEIQKLRIGEGPILIFSIWAIILSVFVFGILGCNYKMNRSMKMSSIFINSLNAGIGKLNSYNNTISPGQAHQEQPHRSTEVDRGRRKVMGGSPGFQPGFLPQTQGQQPNALNIHNGSNM